MRKIVFNDAGHMSRMNANRWPETFTNDESNTLRTEACDSSLDDQNAVGSSGGIEVIGKGCTGEM